MLEAQKKQTPIFRVQQASISVLEDDFDKSPKFLGFNDFWDVISFACRSSDGDALDDNVDDDDEDSKWQNWR